MTTYLTVITTALVVTQIIRLIQNAIQLHRQREIFNLECKDLKNINVKKEDFERQKRAYELIVEYLERKIEVKEQVWNKCD